LTHRDRVVVVMERHTLPESRWAGVRLLPVLRRAGATHLAFEAPLQEPPDRADRDRAVRAQTVPYAFDPSRAALVRAALRLGLRLVAFDYPTASVAADELEEQIRMRERRLVSESPKRGSWFGLARTMAGSERRSTTPCLCSPGGPAIRRRLRSWLR
jgi:hypothetical protein